MSDINEIKRLIAESEGVELSNWNTATHAQREAWASIETQGRAWIIEFITTIESQKEEIKLLKGNIEGLTQTLEDKAPYAAQQYWNWLLGKGKDDLESENESLKAITELAVKGLKKISTGSPDAFTRTYCKDTLSEIEKLQNE